MPILLYKAEILGRGGTYSIEGPVKFGMIILGQRIVDIFPNTGITLNNKGKVSFRGKIILGNSSAISVGPSGRLTFGDDIIGSAGLKVVCYSDVSIGDRVRIGWNTQILDTDLHVLKNTNGRKSRSKGFAPVVIEDGVWIANTCKLYKGTHVPHSCVVSSDTVLHSDLNCEPYSVIGNERNTVIHAVGYYRDLDDDKIVYE